MSSITIIGRCAKIIFQNPESGYTIFNIIDNEKSKHTCCGTSPHIKNGQMLKISGQMTESKYGMQLTCEIIEPILPKDKKGIIRYLSSGIIPGIGEGFAKKLVSFAGERLFDILDEDPSSLYSIKGIGEKRLDGLVKNWRDYRNAHEVMMFLARYQIGPKRAMKIYQTYGEETLQILSQNPYQVYQDISGIGFKIADQIALSSGIAEDALIRIASGLQFVIEQSIQSGHCFIDLEYANKQLDKLLTIDTKSILPQILDDKRFHVTKTNQIYLKSIYNCERQIEKQLKRIQSYESVWRHHTQEQYEQYLESMPNIQLSPKQKASILNVLNSKIGIITGGPGVGKTTITKAILLLAKQAKLRTVLCAPTGRAAKKLASATCSDAKTIHRLLKMDPIERKFQYHIDNPLKADLIIIDEASMIDVHLAHHLFNAIDPMSNIIIIGDIDQLPSVGPGAVLKDLISIIPNQTAHLTEIFRQAKGSRIIQNAHLVNQGKMLIPNEQDQLSDFYFIPESNPQAIIDKIHTLIQQRIPKRFNLHPVNDIQILCPMHKGTLGTSTLNTTLQQALNPNSFTDGLRYKVGDKVIQTRNNYDKDVFNGDVGFVQAINPENSEVVIDFSDQLVSYLYSELDEIQLAYAISIHKSQGSEYPAVIIPLAMQHFTLLERNLLYTAITRGKNLVILIGEMKAVAMAIRNQNSNKRNSHISLN